MDPACPVNGLPTNGLVCREDGKRTRRTAGQITPLMLSRKGILRDWDACASRSSRGRETSRNRLRLSQLLWVTIYCVVLFRGGYDCAMRSPFCQVLLPTRAASPRPQKSYRLDRRSMMQCRCARGGPRRQILPVRAYLHSQRLHSRSAARFVVRSLISQTSGMRSSFSLSAYRWLLLLGIEMNRLQRV